MSDVVKEYRRPDIEGGVLTNPNEIAYYRKVQENDVISNNMLGDYNQKGNYIVSKAILEELLQLAKTMQHSYGRTLFCLSAKQIKKYGYLEFAVKIQRSTDDKKQAQATLELLEPVNKVGGYYQNINTVTIASYKDEYNSDFLKNVYAAFNIIASDEYKGRKRLLGDTKEIEARKNYLEELKHQSRESLEETEKKFYEQRVDALNKSGSYGKSILVKLQLESKKVGKTFLKKGTSDYYKKMNELLDKVLEENKKIEDKSLNDEFEQSKKELVKRYAEIIENSKEKMLDEKNLPKDVIEAQTKQQEEAKTQEKPYVAQGEPGLGDKVIQVENKNVELLNKKGDQDYTNEANEKNKGEESGLDLVGEGKRTDNTVAEEKEQKEKESKEQEGSKQEDHEQKPQKKSTKPTNKPQNPKETEETNVLDLDK